MAWRLCCKQLPRAGCRRIGTGGRLGTNCSDRPIVAMTGSGKQFQLRSYHLVNEVVVMSLRERPGSPAT